MGSEYSAIRKSIEDAVAHAVDRARASNESPREIVRDVMRVMPTMDICRAIDDRRDLLVSMRTIGDERDAARVEATKLRGEYSEQLRETVALRDEYIAALTALRDIAAALGMPASAEVADIVPTLTARLAMSRQGVLDFVGSLSERWAAEAKTPGLDRQDRAEMRAWSAAAKRVRAELDRAWPGVQP